MIVASVDLAGALAQFEESLKIDERAASNLGSAKAQRDLSISLERLGGVLVASGDPAGARDRFEQSLKIRERLTASNPVSAEAQRDLSVSLSKLGEALVALGDLAGGRDRFEQSLKIAERLAVSNPASAEAQRDLIVDHARLGILSGSEHHWREALRIALDLQGQGRLAPSDARMIDELRKQVAAAENAKP